MEQLQVFDENKKLLNEAVARDKKLQLPDGKYFMIIVVFIENHQHQYLIQKTSAERESVYATTGGHVTYGDTGKVTAQKELKEELGIDISLEELEYIDTLKYPKAYCEIYYVSKETDLEKIQLQEEEVEKVEWMTEEEIERLIQNKKFRKGNIEPFQKVKKAHNS